MNTRGSGFPLPDDRRYVPTLRLMRTRYEGTVADSHQDAMAAKLAQAGVFDDVEDFFDALDSGADVLSDHADSLELVEHLKLKRPA